MSETAETQEQVTQEELSAIVDATKKRDASRLVAERAAMEFENANLKHQITVQHVFLKYKLSVQDSIDDKTGVITRAPAPEESSEGSGE